MGLYLYLKDLGYDVLKYHGGLRDEEKEYYQDEFLNENCNVIIAPDGIIGNIIFRTLILVNSWPSCGAITFGINGIYIDTSRDQTVEGYLRSLIFAYKLANI